MVFPPTWNIFGGQNCPATLPWTIYPKRSVFNFSEKVWSNIVKLTKQTLSTRNCITNQDGDGKGCKFWRCLRPQPLEKRKAAPQNCTRPWCQMLPAFLRLALHINNLSEVFGLRIYSIWLVRNTLKLRLVIIQYAFLFTCSSSAAPQV